MIKVDIRMLSEFKTKFFRFYEIFFKKMLRISSLTIIVVKHKSKVFKGFVLLNIRIIGIPGIPI